MDGIDLSGDIPDFPDSTSNGSPFVFVDTPHTADVPNASDGGGIFTGVKTSISKIFERSADDRKDSPFDQASAAGLNYVQLRMGGNSKPARGAGPDYVGAVNPSPGDYLKNIFTKLAQPNNYGASPKDQDGVASKIDKKTLYILGGFAALVVLLIVR